MRGTGLTKAMVEAIPADGGTLIVHSHQMRRYVGQMIQDLRGKDLWKQSKVVVVEHPSDLVRLHGLRGYVDIDHAVEENVHPIMSAELRHVVQQIRGHKPDQGAIKSLGPPGAPTALGSSSQNFSAGPKNRAA